MNTSQFTTSIRFKFLLDVYQNWLKKGDSVLDIGCGNGIITKLLKDNLAIKIIGSDIKNYLIHDIPFIKIENNTLSSIKRKYDFAMLNDVLHHVPKNHQEKLISESLNTAKKILIFEAEPTFLGKMTDIILNKYHYGSLDTPLSFRSANQWQRLFKKLNLKSYLIRARKPFWYPFSHIAFLIEKNHYNHD